MKHPSQHSTWEMVATDLFHWDNNDYLLVVYYLSRYIEISKLPNTLSKTVIAHTKSILARHGIRVKVRSDNGPQNVSQEYKQFASSQGFTHITTSPYHSQANGLAEKSVQIIKRILEKSKASAQDPYLGILEYRNTIINQIASPAQLSMSRRLRSIIPVIPKQLEPKVVSTALIAEGLKRKQQKQKDLYDRGSKPLLPLSEGEMVRLQVQNRWQPATVVRQANTPRSFEESFCSCYSRHFI